MEITLNVTLLTALIALILTVVISFCSVFAGLGFVFKILLNPVKENQVLLKETQSRLENNQVRLEKRMDNIETEVKGINVKLDQIIKNQNGNVTKST